jgi:hypothetical protein
MRANHGIRRLTDRELQELRLFLRLPGPFTIRTETRMGLVRLGVLGQYGRTGTFFVTEAGHRIAQGVGWS